MFSYNRSTFNFQNIQKMRARTSRFTKIIFAVILMIPLLVWIPLFSSFLKDKNIANSGTLVDAEVINYYCNLEVNGEPIYVVKYRFLGKDGNYHLGETDSNYTLYEVEGLTTLAVRYDENFNSVRADFGYSNQIYLWILPIFGCISIGLWIWIFFDIRNAIFERNAQKYGTETFATFYSYGSKYSVNGCTLYFMVYQYTDQNGNLIKKTTKNKYIYGEIMFFQSVKDFRIKVYKNHIAITEPIDMSKVSQPDIPNFDPKAQGKTYKKCDYCGSIVDENEKRCPSCGSRSFHEYKK